ncbi:trypsin-like serine peptidase [Streptomyces sp. NPDC127084]|uniref:trypsin-like serine peptidase n=1 Tax=Streptomyces sp. NPDC127084 TaxID=3347133 RepID=UPI00364FABEE
MRLIRVLAVLTVPLVVLAALVASCGSPKGTGSASAGNGSPPLTLPSENRDLEKLREALRDGGWKDWDKAKWLREAADFLNPIIEGLWDLDRLRDANKLPGEEDRPDISTDDGTTDPQPAAVQAKRLNRPFHTASPATGKLLFDTPEGQAVCSATVVSDPAHPGKSNLVWTAGHCVHAGAQGGWYRNVVFVPSYNDQGLTGSRLQGASMRQLAPYGTWWAARAAVSQQWIDDGGESSRAASAYPYDFAVLKVSNPNNTHQTLEEAVGSAVPVWFDAPTSADIDRLEARGYPAAAPYDGYGYQQYRCSGDPVRLTVKARTPPMHWLGCTMTAGSSGGGWFARKADRTLALVSNTSIGPKDGNGWLAGPHLGSEAKQLFDSVRK